MFSPSQPHFLNGLPAVLSTATVFRPSWPGLMTAFDVLFSATPLFLVYRLGEGRSHCSHDLEHLSGLQQRHLQGLLQNENAEPYLKTTEDFKTVTAEH